jgi:signal peptidase I
MAVERLMEKSDDGISLSAPVIMELIEAVHEKGVSFRFQARGHSMTPAIRDGDYVTLSPLGDLLPRRGDVLAFRHPDLPQMLVHRVLHTKEKKYFIKGDNRPEADGWIPAENILGIITQVERWKKVRFWPNYSTPSYFTELYLTFYPLWPPMRRVMANGWRRLKRIVMRRKLP